MKIDDNDSEMPELVRTLFSYLSADEIRLIKGIAVQAHRVIGDLIEETLTEGPDGKMIIWHYMVVFMLYKAAKDSWSKELEIEGDIK